MVFDCSHKIGGALFPEGPAHSGAYSLYISRSYMHHLQACVFNNKFDDIFLLEHVKL